MTWVAIPGRDVFLRGGLAPEHDLDDAAYEAAVRHATTAGWFAGIKIKDELERQKPAAMSREEFIVRHSIGTDFALNFARTAYSARLPTTQEAMDKVIAYLNGVNESAQKSGYIWNMYTNNCSHVAHNALAAAGVWDPKLARGRDRQRRKGGYRRESLSEPNVGLLVSPQTTSFGCTSRQRASIDDRSRHSGTTTPDAR